MSVLRIFTAVAGFFTVRQLAEKATIDDLFFRLHYRTTTGFLLLGSALVTAYSFIGHPMTCLSDSSVSHIMTLYCWITSTYTLPTKDGLGTEGVEKYHSYYQWVPFVLFFQGILFYMPHWIWKQWESKEIQAISEGIRGFTKDSKADRASRTEQLAQYIYQTMRDRHSYAAVYFFCHILNFVNVVTNIFMIDSFLGNSFLNYGIEVFQFINQDPETRDDPMIRIFPHLTKCKLHPYGPSGTTETRDALCVLALNVMNEKIYIFLWFWLFGLAVVSGFALIYMTIVLFPVCRKLVVNRLFNFNSKIGTDILVKKTQIGDFLLLYLLSQNINRTVFKEVLESLVDLFNSNASTFRPMRT